MLGNLLGSPAAGLIGDLFGWRAIFVFMGLTGVVALIAALVGFRGLASESGGKFDAGEAIANYRAIFRNPLAKFCYGAVFLEGVFLFGLFPYIANLLAAHGEPRASIAGIVLAGFGLGGIAYSVSVSVLLNWLGEKRLMIGGGLIMGIALMIVSLRMPWPVEFLNFALMGFGFYMLHGVIQIYASELSLTARGSAMAMHSLFFFTGLAFGPVVYRIGFPTIGVTATLIVAGIIIMIVGVVCASRLQHATPAR
jgi:predicted MFS family arabinose efflux permease